MQQLVHNHIYDWMEIVTMDFPIKRFIKEDGKKGFSLLGSVNFHEQNFFEGYTFELIPQTTKFRVLENDFSKSKVWRFTTIRNIEWEIRRLENYIWTLKFEFKSNDEIKHEECRLDVLKSRLLEVVRGGVLS